MKRKIGEHECFDSAIISKSLALKIDTLAIHGGSSIDLKAWWAVARVYQHMLISVRVIKHSPDAIIFAGLRNPAT